MPSIKRVASIFFAIMFMVACFSNAVQAACSAMLSSEETVTVLGKDNGGQVSVPKGDILVIRLEAIPGTGYGWQVVRNDTEQLKPLGKPVFEPLGKDLVGATEHQVFRFKALAPGSTELELHYVRPWEKEVLPANTFRIKVVIH